MMSDAGHSSQPDTQKKSDGSTDSPQEQDPHVPLQEGPSKQSSLVSLSGTEQTSYPVLKTKGGTIEEITDSIAGVLSKGKSPKLLAATKGFLQRNSMGFVGALVMRCKGTGCPILDVCPLAEAGEALPRGKLCPFEMGLIQVWVDKHLMALGIKDHLAPENSFDMDLIYSLAAHELIKWKAAHHISHKGNLIEERKVSTTITGDAIFAEVITPALEIIDVNNKITMKIKDVLLATRKAQVQAGKDMGDHSKKAAELARRARKAIQRRLGSEEEVVDTEFTVVEEPQEG